MKCWLYCVDDYEFWSHGPVKDFCTQQHSVYMFDPESGTRCCEATVSSEMNPAFQTFTLKENLSGEEGCWNELIDDDISKYPNELRYVHRNRVMDLPRFKENEPLPTPLPKAFVIEWDDDDDYEEIEEFLDYLRGNPPL